MIIVICYLTPPTNASHSARFDCATSLHKAGRMSNGAFKQGPHFTSLPRLVPSRRDGPGSKSVNFSLQPSLPLLVRPQCQVHRRKPAEEFKLYVHDVHDIHDVHEVRSTFGPHSLPLAFESRLVPVLGVFGPHGVTRRDFLLFGRSFFSHSLRARGSRSGSWREHNLASEAIASIAAYPASTPAVLSSVDCL